MSQRCLIGYTGFVGSTLINQTQFEDLYNSSNIESILGKEYELIICAGAPAVKWKANQSPDEDMENINRLITSIKGIRAKKFVLVSTVDVYNEPFNVNEETIIETTNLEPYGRNRYILELFVKEHFQESLIVRLPGLFGKGLKKNFIYDLINNNALHLTDSESIFQFYNMKNLWNDIEIALNESLNLVNFSTEPVIASEIADYCGFGEFLNSTNNGPVHYDMRSKHWELFNPMGYSGYFNSKEMILKDIKEFIESEMRKLNK